MVALKTSEPEEKSVALKTRCLTQSGQQNRAFKILLQRTETFPISNNQSDVDTTELKNGTNTDESSSNHGLCGIRTEILMWSL